MSAKTESVVQAHWLANQLLGWNSISYGDDTVTLLNSYSADNAGVKKHYAFAMADTTMASIVKYNDDVWAEIQLFACQIKVNDLVLSCGEGAMGNEGVVVAATDNNELVWALFATESNPFSRLELASEILLAYSDYVIYAINIDNPTRLTISRY